MQLPPGCKVNYSIWIDVDKLSDDMCEWFDMIGGKVYHQEEYNFSREGLRTVPKVQYGKAKPSYHRQDGTGYVKINFNGDDASTASVFLIKFNEHVRAHNMKTEFELIK